MTKSKKPKAEHYINESIPYPKIFVIDENKINIGVILKKEAIFQAKSKNLDLVLISVNKNEKGEARPIARIMDYGRYKYDRKKKEKELKEKQVLIQNREIRLTINIGEHDMKFKAKKAREFLMDGDRLKISLKFKGREKSRIELGEETLNKFVSMLDDIAQITKPALFTGGKFLDIYLQQDKKKMVKFLKNQNTPESENGVESKGEEDAEKENKISS